MYYIRKGWERKDIMNNSIKRLTYTSLMIALVFICTVVIAIPSPLGGYINLGDAAIYIGSYFLGPAFGFLAAALGSMMGDLYLGYIPYMIGTLLIKGTMGAVSGYFFKKEKLVLGVILGLVIMVLGYYGFEIILLQNVLSPLVNIPFNGIQGSMGSLVGYALIQAMKKSKLVASI